MGAEESNNDRRTSVRDEDESAASTDVCTGKGGAPAVFSLSLNKIMNVLQL